MIVKLIGIICIIVSSTLLGWYMDRLQILRIQDLEGLRRALHMLHAEVNYSITPLPIALKEIINKNDTRVNCIFIELIESINAKSGESISLLWQRAVKSQYPYVYLEREDLEILSSFGQSLGYLDKEMQKKNIEITIGYLKDQINKLDKLQEKSGKLYRNLGALAGCLLCILLF